MASTNYGRHEIPHPDLGTVAGAPLHAEVVAGFTKIGNNLTGRWSGITASFANAASVSLEHNFGLNSDRLRVVVQEGDELLDTNQRDAKYNIAYDDDNNLTVTNASGGTITNFSFYVYPRIFLDVQSLELTAVNDTTSGSNASLSSPTTGIKRLTNASLVSVNNIVAPVRGMFFAMFNDTGVSVTIINNSGGTAANRIITGTNANIVLSAGASLLLFYDLTEQRWLVVGGAGGGTTTDLGVSNQAGGGTISGVTSGVNQVRVVGSLGGTPSAPIDVEVSNTPFTTTAPLDGTEVYVYGSDDANTVTFIVGDVAKGFIGNGPCTLGRYCSLHVKYSANFDRWLEVSRNIVGGY